MSWSLNPEVPPFIPKPRNASSHGNGIQNSSKHQIGSGARKPTISPLKFSVENDEDFPSIVPGSEVSEDAIWTRAGFRSFKDVAASTGSSEGWRGSSVQHLSEVRAEGGEEKTVKRKKRRKKCDKTNKSDEIDGQQNKLKPKSQGMTLDQIVLAKIMEEVSKKKVAPSKPKRGVRRRKDQEAPRNKLDSTAPKQRKGKTREVPKKKKPTTLKKFIIMEKEMRKKNLTASKDFKRKNLEIAVDAVFKSVDLTSHLNEEKSCFREIGSGDHEDSTEPNDEVNDGDLVLSMSSLSLEEEISKLIHCNDYRDYCNQCLTDEIDELATNLLCDIVRLQDKKHAKDAQKAAMKRRYCCGLKEVEKYLTIKKVKCLLMAPDIQQIVRNGVLDQTVQKLIRKCQETETPIVFCLTRHQLGYLCKKRAKISCVAILDPSGLYEPFKSLIQSAIESRNEYDQLRNEVTKLIEVKGKFPNDDVVIGRKINELRMRMKRQTLFWRKNKKNKSSTTTTNLKEKSE